MFYYKYNIMNDGEFVLGFNDFDEAMKAYQQIMLENDFLSDHEWQMLEVIRGVI